VWRSAVQTFSSGGSGFDPSFSNTEKVRVVGVDQIRQTMPKALKQRYDTIRYKMLF